MELTVSNQGLAAQFDGLVAAHVQTHDHTDQVVGIANINAQNGSVLAFLVLDQGTTHGALNEFDQLVFSNIDLFNGDLNAADGQRIELSGAQSLSKVIAKDADHFACNIVVVSECGVGVTGQNDGLIVQIQHCGLTAGDFDVVVLVSVAIGVGIAVLSLGQFIELTINRPALGLQHSGGLSISIEAFVHVLGEVLSVRTGAFHGDGHGVLDGVGTGSSNVNIPVQIAGDTVLLVQIVLSQLVQQSTQISAVQSDHIVTDAVLLVAQSSSIAQSDLDVVKQVIEELAHLIGLHLFHSCIIQNAHHAVQFVQLIDVGLLILVEVQHTVGGLRISLQGIVQGVRTIRGQNLIHCNQSIGQSLSCMLRQFEHTSNNTAISGRIRQCSTQGKAQKLRFN